MTQYAIGGGSPQTVQNSLVSGGGGELLASSLYSITSSLAVTASVEENILGQGKQTGFNYTGTGTNNVLQLGSGSYWGTKLLIEKVLIKSNATHMTGIFANKCPGLTMNDAFICNVETAFWLVNTYSPRLNNLTMQTITADGVCFDPYTPANNATLFECSGFDVSGAIVCMNNECNGLYVRNGDFETFGTFLRLCGSAGMSYRTIVCAENDFEGMTGSFITNSSNLPIYGLDVRSCTFAGCADVRLTGITGGTIDGCMFYNTNLIVDQTHNSNFTIGKNSLFGTSTLTVT